MQYMVVRYTIAWYTVVHALYSRNSADSTVYHTSEICIIILLQKQFHTIVHSGLEGEKEICISAASDLAL